MYEMQILRFCKTEIHLLDFLGLIFLNIFRLNEGQGNPLQYSCLENSMDREAWWATVHGVARSRTRLSNLHSGTQRHLTTVRYIHIAMWFSL